MITNRGGGRMEAMAVLGISLFGRENDRTFLFQPLTAGLQNVPRTSGTKLVSSVISIIFHTHNIGIA